MLKDILQILILEKSRAWPLSSGARARTLGFIPDHTGYLLMTLFPMTRHGRNQHSLAFQLPSASKDVYMYSFFPQTIRDWNNLPESLISSSELSDDSVSKFDTGYPQDGRADKDSYPHDRRADKDSYPHDGRADKDSYPHDRHNQYIMLRL